MESGISLYLQSTAHTGYAPSKSHAIASAPAHTAGSDTGMRKSSGVTGALPTTATDAKSESAPNRPHRASPTG